MNLRDTYTVMENFVNFMLIKKLRLTHRHWLFFGCTIFLVSIFRINVLQIFNLHCVSELINVFLLTFRECQKVNARPDFAESSRS